MGNWFSCIRSSSPQHLCSATQLGSSSYRVRSALWPLDPACSQEQRDRYLSFYNVCFPSVVLGLGSWYAGIAPFFSAILLAGVCQPESLVWQWVIGTWVANILIRHLSGMRLLRRFMYQRAGNYNVTGRKKKKKAILVGCMKAQRCLGD